MSKADCDANEVLKLQAEIERLQAKAAAMRKALEWFANEQMWSDYIRQDGRCILWWTGERPWEMAQEALADDAGLE